MMRSLLVSASVTLAASVAGCGSSAPPDFPDPDVAAAQTSPSGAPYPTDNLGPYERSNGRPGSRVPNLSFQGYVDGDRSAGLRTISLADYYDPEAKDHKLLVLLAAATWCAICASTSEALVPRKEALEAEGAVFLEVVINGSTVNAGPSLEEVEAWMNRHRSNYSVAIDVRGRRLAGLGVDTVPWSMLVDTRTMEILEAGAGAPADIAKYTRSGLAWVSQNPPSY